MIYTWQVYALINPFSGNPFYVGLTRSLLKNRLSSHISESLKISYDTVSRKQAEISKIIDGGYLPEIKSIFEFTGTKEEAIAVEMRYIKQYQNDWPELTNSQNGLYKKSTWPRYMDLPATRKNRIIKFYQIKLLHNY